MRCRPSEAREITYTLAGSHSGWNAPIDNGEQGSLPRPSQATSSIPDPGGPAKVRPDAPQAASTRAS